MNLRNLLKPIRMTNNIHIHYMQYALRLASRHLGLTMENPSVGCVLVHNAQIGGRVVGVGYTAIGGRPHAETQAIQMAGDLCRGATAYVTLEPCAHAGNTPSCAQALIDAGIKTCYIATADCDNRTHRRGIKMLQESGIAVHVGLLQHQADIHHMGFFLRTTESRPMVTIKIATTIDGKIALSNGQSKWITNEKSRAYGQYLRSTHDAILVGANTVRYDNPVLNCRLSGMTHMSPVRIVLAHNPIPQTSTLLKDGGTAHVLSGHIPSVLKQISALGINRLLVEGGAYTITQFMRSGLVDNIAHFRSSKIIGDDGFSVIGGLNIQNMVQIPTYKILKTKIFDNDIFTLYGGI